MEIAPQCLVLPIVPFRAHSPRTKLGNRTQNTVAVDATRRISPTIRPSKQRHQFGINRIYTIVVGELSVFNLRTPTALQYITRWSFKTEPSNG